MLIYTVLCDGQHHRIGLTKKGQLVGLDHSPKFGRERKFMELGGQEPTCHMMVRQLLMYDHSPHCVPMNVVAAVEKTISKRKARRMFRNMPPFRDYHLKPFDKLRALTQLAVARVWPPKATDKRPTRYFGLVKGQFDLEVCLHGPDHPQPAGTNVACWYRHMDTPKLELWLPTRWLRTVYQQGLAVMDDLLVTDVRWHDREHTEVVLTVLYQKTGGYEFHDLVTQPLRVEDLTGPNRKNVTFRIPWSMK